VIADLGGPGPACSTLRVRRFAAGVVLKQNQPMPSSSISRRKLKVSWPAGGLPKRRPQPSGPWARPGAQLTRLGSIRMQPTAAASSAMLRTPVRVSSPPCTTGAAGARLRSSMM